MNIESFREYCKQKPGVTESFPFNESVLVFKVLDKMFALTDLKDVFKISLKCDPEKAVRLREEYPAIHEAYHLSKKHWNTIDIDETISDDVLFELTDHSYDMAVSKMTKKDKQKLSNLK